MQMQKEKKFIIGYLIIELIIYIAFMSLDLAGQYTISANHILKYIGLLLCPMFLLLYRGLLNTEHRYPNTMITLVALCFTAFSDYFLLVRNDHFLIGILSFIVVQLLYMIRIQRMRERMIRRELVVRACIFTGIGIMAAAVIHKIGRKFDRESIVMAIAAGWYIFNLIMNAIRAGRLAIEKGKPDPATVILALGLMMFIGCDLCVGANNLYAYGVEVTPMLQRFINVAMWGFYLPSQVMITISAIIEQKKQ